MTILDRFKTIWNKIEESPAQLPSRVHIPSHHIYNKEEKLETFFKKDEHYFEVSVNEMFLTSKRKWFNIYSPMVFVVSEFIYGKGQEAVPFIVGPMMMEKYGQKIPNGMIFSNTRVVGLHPYRGGGLTLSVILYRVNRGSYPQKLLEIVENAAIVLDFATALSSYVKVASVVMDGVEALSGLGETSPILGCRETFADDKLQPGYYALIDMPDGQSNTDELWVLDDKLVTGKTIEDTKPFRDADFVLYSINQKSARTDERTLSFFPLWERVAEEAAVPKNDYWENAKHNMISLYQSMVLSPDLTSAQAEQLADEYTGKMEVLHKRATRTAKMAKSDELRVDKFDRFRGKALSIFQK